jgi:hypothetical protein
MRLRHAKEVRRRPKLLTQGLRTAAVVVVVKARWRGGHRAAW